MDTVACPVCCWILLKLTHEWKVIPCFMFRFSLFWRGWWLWREGLPELLPAVPCSSRPPVLPLPASPGPWQPSPRPWPESAQHQDGEQQQHAGGRGRGPGAGGQDQDGGGGVHRLRQRWRGLPAPPWRGQARAGEQEPGRCGWDQNVITWHPHNLTCIVSQEAREGGLELP